MRVMRPEFREEMGALRSDFTTLTGKVIEIDNRLERLPRPLPFPHRCVLSSGHGNPVTPITGATYGSKRNRSGRGPIESAD